MSGEDDRKFYEICINSIETEVSKIESTEESLTETNRGQVLDLCEKCAKNIHFVLENWLSKENREKYLDENPKVRKVLGKYYNLAVYSINSEMTQISIAERRLNYSNFIQIADLCEASANRIRYVLNDWLSNGVKTEFLKEHPDVEKTTENYIEGKNKFILSYIEFLYNSNMRKYLDPKCIEIYEQYQVQNLLKDLGNETLSDSSVNGEIISKEKEDENTDQKRLTNL